jgi:enamine deaminase RidA (YjgF/YER057c/UK114 family)
MACVDQAPFDVTQQTEIIFRRMAQLLADHGATFEHLTKITAFLADIRGEYDAYNAVRNKTFAHLAAPPASSAVGVTLNLSGKLRVEIEAIALVPKEPAKK